MSRSTACLAFVLLLTAGPLVADETIRLENGRRAELTPEQGLAEAVRSLARSSEGAAWIAWQAPIVGGEQRLCCGWSEQLRRGCVCRLEGDDSRSFSFDGDDDRVELEAPKRIVVLLRLDAGRVDDVRSYSSDCLLDAGGLSFTVLRDVSPGESVELLDGLVRDGDGDEVRHGALAALALHAEPSADRLLERLATGDGVAEIRGQAAFWLGVARGRQGFLVLREMLANDDDPEVREQVLFGLSVSDEPDSTDLLIRAARRDARSRVRSQALFWLSQKAGERVAEAIGAAIEDDPDIEVKTEAVFALSQIAGDEAVPLLVEIARSHRQPEVRKAALFWLGQSHDERALDLFEEILGL